MTIIRKLLGVTRYWGKEEPITMGMTLFNHESCFPPFQPVICRKNNFERIKKLSPGDGSHDCINLFPTTKNSSPRNRQSLSGYNVIETESLRILDDREIITVDKIDFNKLGDVHNYVKKHGAVTFSLEDPKHAAELVKNIENLKKGFKHSALIAKNTGSSSPNTAEETIVTYLSVYDLLHAIPIYNRNKVDGMAFHLIMLWNRTTDKQDRPYFAGEFHFAVNQYKENLLVVDGQRTFKEGFVGSDYIGHFHSFLLNEARRQVEVKKSVKKAKKSESRSEKKNSTTKVVVSNDSIKIDHGHYSTNNYYYTVDTSSWTTT